MKDVCINITYCYREEKRLQQTCSESPNKSDIAAAVLPYQTELPKEWSLLMFSFEIP